jgi:hypothetical protein
VAAPAPISATATIHERDPTALDACAGVFVREFSRRTGAIRYGQFGCVCEPHHTHPLIPYPRPWPFWPADSGGTRLRCARIKLLNHEPQARR